MMKKKHIYIYLLGMLLLSVGCTGKFREFNTDQAGVTDDDLLIDDNGYGIRLGIIQQGIYFNYDFGKGKNWPFQLIQNLNADMFSGYMHDGKPLNGGTHNSDYNMQDGWNSAMWTHMYSYIFPQIYQSENATRDTEPALFGITKVLKVEVMHRVTDYYGPVIYKNFANAQNQYRPDTQKEVYYEFFNELDSAVVSLADYIEKKPESNGFTRFDILLDGQYSSWIKFANSLRMRLAMRISAVDPDKARTEFRKGLENEFALYDRVERLAKEEIMTHRKMFKPVCANVDFYSGFVYTMLGIPEELFTPIFAIARIAGWSAHRLEELLNAGKIIRPAYKYVGHHTEFHARDERE